MPRSGGRRQRYTAARRDRPPWGWGAGIRSVARASADAARDPQVPPPTTPMEPAQGRDAQMKSCTSLSLCLSLCDLRNVALQITMDIHA